ncbi:MAG TPA: hypothetical protein EYN79_10640 [Planctomycetes bacterium]|nr:hypothetical protein [Planctomycetota bacterium]HIN79521.1 hypothetical protein [Planctomycetota bacterium]
MRVRGIVLAAGSSRRMGSPKALLVVDGRQVIERVVAALVCGGVDEVLVVTGGEHSAEVRAVAELLPYAVKIVKNPDPTEGPVTSIRAGLRVDGCPDLVLIHPVDVAGIEPVDVKALIDQSGVAAEFDAWIPSVGGRRAHPVLVRREIAMRLLEEGGPPHLRALLREAEIRVHHVEMNAPRLRQDLDEPEDVQRLERLIRERG